MIVEPETSALKQSHLAKGRATNSHWSNVFTEGRADLTNVSSPSRGSKHAGEIIVGKAHCPDSECRDRVAKPRREPAVLPDTRIRRLEIPVDRVRTGRPKNAFSGKNEHRGKAASALGF